MTLEMQFKRRVSTLAVCICIIHTETRQIPRSFHYNPILASVLYGKLNGVRTMFTVSVSFLSFPAAVEKFSRTVTFSEWLYFYNSSLIFIIKILHLLFSSATLNYRAQKIIGICCKCINWLHQTKIFALIKYVVYLNAVYV